MKGNSIPATILFTAIIYLSFAGSTLAQPAWTNLTYTDWNPGTAPAMQGWDYQSRLYECRAAWDGSRFVAILSYEAEEVSPADYRFATSTDGRNWFAGTETETIDIPRTWSVGHHTLAGDPGCFPPTDVAWTEQSQNVKFKLWYARYGQNTDFRYAESTDGRHWNATLEPDYCPPTYKRFDWSPTSRIMIKPTVLYRPKGSTELDTADPMANRYIFYLGSSTIDPTGGSGFFEMYVSSNGLDWTLYAWDNQCQARWTAYTDAAAEVLDFVTFTGCADLSSNQYPCSLQEVFQNGERQGYFFWTENYLYPIYSFYSTNGVDWVCREQPISTIGSQNLVGTDYWNYERNYNLDCVRLGESYFLTRSGRQGAEHYNTGAAVVKGRMSAEVDTPPSPAEGEIAARYLLYHWNGEVCPTTAFTFSTDGTDFVPATMGTGGDGTTDLATTIGGCPHTYVWDSAFDLPDGAAGVYFRVEPEPLEGGSFGTTGPFDVEQAASPTPAPTGSATPTRSPTPTPSPTCSASCGTVTPSPSTTGTPAPSPTAIIIRCFDVSGKVTIRETSALLPGAEVRAYLPDGTSTIGVTNAAGDYRVTICTHFPDGRVETGARKRDYLPTRVEKDYAGWGEVTGLDLALAPASFRPEIVSGDFDGDGRSEVVIFRPETGLWAIRGISRIYFGNQYDDPAPADYDGDGTAEVAVFRGNLGLWAVRGATRRYFGRIYDQPVPGDYTGAGSDAVVIFRGYLGLWAVAGGNRWYFGGTGDQAAPGDYDGDGIRDGALFRRDVGLWAIRSLSRFYFGADADRLVPGDYEGEGSWRTAIFRPVSGLWAIRGLTRIYFGRSGDQPAAADFSGDDRDDFAIFRESTGLWMLRGISRAYFGRDGDLQLTR